MQDGDRSDTESSTFLSACLEDFSIYRRHRTLMNEFPKRSREAPLANQLVSLHEINERNIDYLLFDGLICFGEHQQYVRGISFDLLSIGRYQALETTTVGSDIWIQSFEGSKRDVWY